jgi:hypothetical protein
MIFSLEALQAEKGDSLILHFGKPEAPRFIVIDGGPAPVYQISLKPRLEELHARWKREDDEKLDIEMAMISHIDDDHIHGILDWLEELNQSDKLPFNIQTIWHNSFDDVVGNASDELSSRLAAVTASALDSGEDREGMQPMSAAVLASVNQGRKLRSMARQLGIPLNRGFRGLVSSTEMGKAVLNIGAGLGFTVLCPTMKRLEALNKEWEKTLRELQKAGTAEIAAFVDRSVANLSSIVVLAELDGKRILFTGDARGDHILEGLERAELLENGKIHVDLFKIPHHGSNRNAALELFQKITADHYVISANGENGNPDPEVFTWITEARGEEAYTIYVTNKKLVDPKKNRDVFEAIQKVLDANPASGRKVVFHGKDDPRIRVDLLDKVTY